MLSYANILPVCNEVELHPLNTQEKLLTFLHQNKILPIGYCPLARGADTSSCPNLMEHPLVRSLSDKYKCSGSQLILSWSIHRGCAVIPKSSNPERLRENFECQSLKLEEEDVAQISTLNENVRICGDGIPWLFGNNIFA